MYENEKNEARVDFIARFRWNNEDGVLLRKREGDDRLCITKDCAAVGTTVLHDYEDDFSGGVALCDEHASETVWESSPPEPWVSQDPRKAWVGPNGNGWQGIWFLFAPVGTYAKDGVWPYEEAKS